MQAHGFTDRNEIASGILFCGVCSMICCKCRCTVRKIQAVGHEMNINRRDALKGVANCLLLAGAAPALSWTLGRRSYRTLDWPDLLPPDWDPAAVMREAKIDSRAIAEGSDQESQAWRKLRPIWDSAPVRSDLNGAWVRMPGYVVTIDQSGEGTREFLLVPYFGACIHLPPPPINQIVLVRLKRATRIQTSNVLWIWGQLQTQLHQTSVASAGYLMLADGFSPYRE